MLEEEVPMLDWEWATKVLVVCRGVIVVSSVSGSFSQHCYPVAKQHFKSDNVFLPSDFDVFAVTPKERDGVGGGEFVKMAERGERQRSVRTEFQNDKLYEGFK